MAEHFPRFDRSIVAMRLSDFLQWVEELWALISENSLRLPPVQRTALWTPKQVLDLWDSLLRGLPIGCFYLADLRRGRSAA